MRYLSFLAVVLASAPAYAQFTDTIVLQPGFAVAWQADQPFTKVRVGNSEMVDVSLGSTNRQLIITVKPVSPTNPVQGTTNILLQDDDGKQIGNVLVAKFRSELVRSAAGTWQVYRKP